MKNLIVGNWKMNPATEKEAHVLFDAVKEGVKDAKNAMPTGRQVEVVICPPFVFLSVLSGLTLGAQNVSYRELGAFTGEVSPLQLKDLRVKYVIVGHSESRKNLHETDEDINKKIKQCVTEQLMPIFCIGENDGENKEEVLKRQLIEGLKGVSEKELENVVVAYEPIWAIGTGKNCSTEETIHSVLFIRKIIADLYSKEVSLKVKILYGGSVNSQNSKEYLEKGGVQGLLVGGASLKADEFVKIVMSA